MRPGIPMHKFLLVLLGKKAQTKPARMPLAVTLQPG